MKKFKPTKYFQWGGLNLEPSDFLVIEQSEIDDAYLVKRIKDNASIIVSKKAFANYISIGLISEV